MVLQRSEQRMLELEQSSKVSRKPIRWAAHGKTPEGCKNGKAAGEENKQEMLKLQTTRKNSATGKSSLRNKHSTEPHNTLLARQSTESFRQAERQLGVSDGFQTLGSKIKLIQQLEIIFWKETFFFPLSPILYLSWYYLIEIENSENHSKKRT